MASTNSNRSVIVIAMALLLGVGGGIAGGIVAATVNGAMQPASTPTVTQALPIDTEPASDSPATQIAQMVLPSVVFIAVDAGDEGGLGSGFVIREDGYIVTNSHVIAGASEDGINVEFTDGTSAAAELVGSDTSYDIAVLKVDRDNLPVLAFADSDELQVGQQVLAVGAPLGLDNTVTLGIVSALDRPVVAGEFSGASYINAIQTDAAINPGNSGGPLLDLSGRVVGVNSAIAQLPSALGSAASGSIGLGFAIPAEQVQITAEQLIETGTSEHPVIGVFLDLEYAGDGARVGDDLQDGTPGVDPNGAAAAAGLVSGDIITSIDGRDIKDGSQLIVILRSYRVGDIIEAEVLDTDGGRRTVTMTLQGSSE
ncbi:trypsin-like peptidase domain-containing protein [Ornithinimicrobium sp. Arc0846-15]|nr:trypsin-like peptidase domain-containing protein [Ornithinimicrobium laminariae]